MYLPGVGPRKAEILKQEAGIVSCEDLLYYFPYKHIDRSRFYNVSEVEETMPYIQLKGKILFFDTVGEMQSKRLIAKFTDGTGTIDLVWFKGLKWIVDKYKTGREYIVFGRPTAFRDSVNIIHPDIDSVEDTQQVASGFSPFYNTTEKMKKAFLHSRSIQNLQYTLLTSINWYIPDILPAYILEKTRMMSLSEAIRNIHFPESAELLKKAQLRLKFDELFFIQLNILQTARIRRQKLGGIVFEKAGDALHEFYNKYLPFELTNAQKRVIREIRADVGSGRQMSRLLQGDIGSGKTLVALFAMLMATGNKYQACMMAPTEILAQQHYATLTKYLKDMKICVAILTGSTKAKARKEILQGLATGEIHFIIGTHALIEDTVIFDSLGLAVIDEQHRFGVEQRSRLWIKNKKVPHILIMTATPIPRTLAMTLYGDLDVSVIDEMPPERKPIQTVHRYYDLDVSVIDEMPSGRKPIRTIHSYDKKRAELYAFLRSEIQKGCQVYVVYPLIEESEKLDIKNLEEGFEVFKEAFPEYKVCMVHGKMKPKEKETAMSSFVSGEAQILVATTVIEVGVDVPKASVMVIESAERFGLSQLHQLRGRVGRGADQSYCIMVSSYKLSNDTRKRLEIMVNSNDGFEIAEADMQLRGYGDLEGTQQSGDGIDLKIANLAVDGQILQYARNLAESVLEKDPDLESEINRLLRERLQTLFNRKVHWGRIG